MRWFRSHRLTAAEALELELAGFATGSSAAELLPVTDRLRAAAEGLPPPTVLRARRPQLVALASPTPRLVLGGAARGRLVRATVIALAVATLAAVGVLGATLITSRLHSAPPPLSVHAPALDPSIRAPDVASQPPHTSQPQPAGDAGQTPGPRSGVDDPQLLAKLKEACGEEATLPDLSGLDETEARALVDALIAACEAASGTPLPGETPQVLTDDLGAELLAKLKEACGEEATLPDLSGLHETEARALVDALIAACEAATGIPLP